MEIRGQRPFCKGWHPAHPTFYVKKEVYQRYGLFDLDFKFAADFELMLRLIDKEHIKLYYLPEPLVRMRLGELQVRIYLILGKEILNV